jgi:uracil-DNA glycosylase family 4
MATGKDLKKDSSQKLNAEIIDCDKCPRLRSHCQKIAKEKRKSFAEWTYWGKPVSNFGDPKARLLIVGLAPAAHGANRTGRMFTGDRSGDWLYRALHKAGFANQPTSTRANDGLKLHDCVITAVAHCAPPDNKPSPQEMENCHAFLERAFTLYRPQVVIALGGIAWSATLDEFKRRGQWSGKRPDFSHGREFTTENGTLVIGSYHPSQQNTFTKRLTEPMFDKIFSRARAALSSKNA